VTREGRKKERGRGEVKESARILSQVRKKLRVVRAKRKTFRGGNPYSERERGKRGGTWLTKKKKGESTASNRRLKKKKTVEAVGSAHGQGRGKGKNRKTWQNYRHSRGGTKAKNPDVVRRTSLDRKEVNLGLNEGRRGENAIRPGVKKTPRRNERPKKGRGKKKKRYKKTWCRANIIWVEKKKTNKPQLGRAVDRGVVKKEREGARA